MEAHAWKNMLVHCVIMLEGVFISEVLARSSNYIAEFGCKALSQLGTHSKL